MIPKIKSAAAMGLVFMLLGAGILLAQSETPAAPCELKAEQAALAGQLADFSSVVDSDPDAALATLFQIGAAYQEMATRCGYAPSQEEREALADYVLTLVDIPTILIRNTVGTDVDAILAKLEGQRGDPINGQLLYNDLEMGVDGAALGCANCHTEEGSAPPTEGTWTRVTGERLNDPALADYTFERYIVESVVLPAAYTAPDYLPNLMPDNFGRRLELDDLADLIAFLESQDQ